MADDPEQLLANNRAWATQVEPDDPGFHCLTTQQRPQYLWIGCSNSRVAADQITGLGQDAAVARMCEMNVHHQLRSLCHTRVLREAWKAGQRLSVHGWIYSVEHGLLRDLGTRVDAATGLTTLDRIDSWT